MLHRAWNVTLSLQQPPVWWNRHKARLLNTTNSFSLRNLLEGCITVTVEEHPGWILHLRQKSLISPTTFHGLWILNETTQSKFRSEAETLWRGRSLGDTECCLHRKVHSSDAGKRPCDRVPWRNDCRRDMATGALGDRAAPLLPVKCAAAPITAKYSGKHSDMFSAPTDSFLTLLLPPLFTLWSKRKVLGRQLTCRNICLSETNLLIFLQHIHGYK